MSSQNFFLLAFIVAGVVIWIFRGSLYRRRDPTLLQMPKSPLEKENLPLSPKETHARSLNVIFVYNGHTFDAHEILGIPPGSSIEAIDQAYQRALLNCEPDSRIFLQAAHDAIIAKLKGA